MAQNVKFISVGLQETFDALATKDALALYWIQDTQRLYKGDQLYGVGVAATEEFAGLMSAEDKAALETLKAGGGLTNLVPVDGTIKIANAADGGKSIGVSIAPIEGNALKAVDGGLFVPKLIAGNGIAINDDKISIKLANEANGLVAVDGTLQLNLATKTSNGAMSKEDKKFLDAIPELYLERKYEISHKPEGTLVDYREKEIRVMCSKDTEWKLQTSGTGADPNSFYIGFKSYAPKNAVGFKEDLAEIVTDPKMYYFENNDFAGVDAYGRKYAIAWLPVAKHTDGVWTYYGAKSTKTKYIGWYYSVEWYNESGKIIDTDTIRINLSNEDCHNNINAFYGTENDVAAQVETVKETVAELEQAYSWGEM